MSVNYATEYTPRLRITYVVDGETHTALLRVPRDTTPWDASAAQDLAGVWRDAMNGIFTLTSLQPGDNRAQSDIIQVEFAQQDDDLFLPSSAATTEIVPGDDTSGSATPLTRATLISITGKTTMGKPVLLYFWGQRLSTGMGTAYSDWRYSESEAAGFGPAFLAHLDPDTPDSLASLIGGPDGHPIAFFRRYVNVRVSAKAINRARST